MEMVVEKKKIIMINPELELAWEIARREKVYRKDKKVEVFDRSILEDVEKVVEEIPPGDYKIHLFLEYDMRRLKEEQWLKYICELFEISEGWRSFDFRVKSLPVYSPRRSYEFEKEVKVRVKGDSKKISKFLKAFFMPESVDFADILLAKIINQHSNEVLYSASFASPSSKLKPLIEGKYQDKLPYRESITINEIPFVVRYYEELPGHYVVQDCLNRNVSARCAVDKGEGFIARGEYCYSLKKEQEGKLSEIESKIFNYMKERKKVAFLKEISYNLNLDEHEAHRALVKLWKRGLLNRKRMDFNFETTDSLINCVLINNAYEFIWNSNRIGETYPSRLTFDFDPPEWKSYSECRDIVNDFYNYLVDLGFRPRLRTTGGKVGGAHILLFLEFREPPKNYSEPFPRDKKLHKLIEERGKEGLTVAAAIDFLRSLILEFGIKRKKPTPITLETRDRTERLHNIYVDVLRCFPNVGTRSIGTIHHVNRPGGPYVCRAWEVLPESEKEVRSTSTMGYVLKNPEVLVEPRYSREENPFSLVEETLERTSHIPQLYKKFKKSFYIKYIRRKF